MRSLLQQLENNEHVLMMYAADELPEQDRAEVEQMLAVDPGLRAELERLTEAQGVFAADMARLDAATPLPLSEVAAARRVGRAAARWQTRRVARPAPVEKRRLRYPWWAYPAAAAGSVVVAFLVWWGNQPQGPAVMVLPAEPYADISDGMNPDAFADGGFEEAVVPSWDPLDEVERDVWALSNADVVEQLPFFAEPGEQEAGSTDDF